MGNKINIAELLKVCPKGMELYSPIFGKVYLDKIRPHLAIVVTTDKEQGDFKEEFLYDGRYGINGECMLFSSKGKTTWEGFVPPCKFKDGDVIVASGAIAIFKQVHSLYEEPQVDFYCGVTSKHRSFILKTGDGQHCGKISSARLATEEEKAELGRAIKDNGYKWNDETKTLEKLPKFKVGDVIVNIHRKHLHCDGASGKISQITDDKYIFTDGSYISISNQDDWELVPNKFDITTLKPFDKVLVRDTKEQVWVADLFSHMVNRPLGGYTFACVGHYPSQCIPYEGNEHLLGTTDDCDDFYKTWEE